MASVRFRKKAFLAPNVGTKPCPHRHSGLKAALPQGGKYGSGRQAGPGFGAKSRAGDFKAKTGASRATRRVAARQSAPPQGAGPPAQGRGDGRRVWLLAIIPSIGRNSAGTGNRQAKRGTTPRHSEAQWIA